ncbi:hypothetical protein [Kineococcus sp. G2]|uniref:hypothetical protein n=1 Tax=Kineococcus sp. G2 TaxID=3127484 RepID=UPI00301BBF69
MFARELAAAGARVEHRVLPESSHGLLNRPHEEAFTTGVEAIAGWLQSVPGREPLQRSGSGGAAPTPPAARPAAGGVTA